MYVSLRTKFQVSRIILREGNFTPHPPTQPPSPPPQNEPLKSLLRLGIRSKLIVFFKISFIQKHPFVEISLLLFLLMNWNRDLASKEIQTVLENSDFLGMKRV